MFQDLDNMEASCVIYVKVSKFTHLEQWKTNLLTVNQSGIVWRTIQQDFIVCVRLVYYAADSFRQVSTDFLSLKHCWMYS
jgi:hypothetical protein